MTTDANAPATTGAPAVVPAIAPVAVATTAPAPAAPAQAAPVAVVVAAPAVAPAPAAPPAATPETDPTWIADRVNRAKQAGAAELLKTLGAPNLEAAQAAIKAANEAAEAKKTAEQKATEATLKLTETAAQVAAKDKLIAEHAGRMLMALTTEQQKAITEYAGDNAAEQLRAIHHFAPLWAAQGVTQALPAVQQTTPVAAAAPAQTAPAPNAPAGVTPGSPPDHRTVYQTTRQTNPFAAAAYAASNPQAYELKT